VEKGNYNIPIAKPYFTGEEVELVAQVLKSGWVCQGPMVAKFEEMIAKYTGAKYAVATTSCTTALHVTMLIEGIGAGHDVLCPSYSFIATANGIRYSGAQPCFVDIDPLTLNIDPIACEEFIEANYTKEMRNRETGNLLKGILIVHQLGIAADIDAFDQIAKRHGLILMEDSACALGSTYKGKPIGSSGNVNTLSFHPRKVISCGEGGMVLTKDQSLADMARVYRAHGASTSDFARHKAGSLAHESYNVVGYNYRMTDIQAAIGIKQMDLLDALTQKRIQIATRYNDAFSKLAELEIINPPTYVTRWNYQSYPLRLAKGGSTERNALLQALQEKGVSTRRGIPPIHKEPVYECGVHLPNTESVSERSLFLPIFPQLTDDEVDHIIDSVKKAVSQPVVVRAS
jgi:perosamine synthetase